MTQQVGPPVARTSWERRPAPIGDDLVGREDALVQVKDGIGTHHTFILTGGPGTGKSRLAAEYTIREGLNGIWVDAVEGPTRALASLAGLFGIPHGDPPDEEALASNVVHLISSLPTANLLVFDNLPGMAEVGELVNRLEGRMLLATTRDSLFANTGLASGVADSMVVEPLVSDPGVRLLARKSGLSETTSEFPKMTEAVGGLPLALEALGAPMANGFVEPAESLERLMTAPDPLKLKVFRDAVGFTIDRGEEGVYQALTGNIASLPTAAQTQLAPLGYVADAPASFDLFGALTGTSGEGRDELLQQCARRSILRLDGTPRLVTMHSLNVAAIRSLDDYGSLGEVATRMAERIATVGHDQPLVTRAEITHAESIIRHVRNRFRDSMPIQLSPFLNNTALWMDRIGRYSDSLVLQEEELGLCQDVLGAEHPSTLQSQNNVAGRYQSLGLYNEAIELHEKTLETMARVLGPEDPQTLKSRNNLATAYLDSGQTEKALEQHGKTLEAMERVLGPEHPDTLGSRNNLASAFQVADRIEEAVKLTEETLEMMERVLGPEHPDTLGCRGNLANVYQVAGRVKEAINLNKKTLEVLESVLGPEHPQTLSSHGNLASAYQVAGRIEEAIKLNEKTLEIRERVLGSEHPDTLLSLVNLAASYGTAGCHERAIELFAAALKSQNRILGAEHPNTLVTRGNLATGYRLAKRYHEAIKLDEKTLEIREQILGADHSDTLSSRNYLAIGYRAVGREKDADRLEEGWRPWHDEG